MFFEGPEKKLEVQFVKKINLFDKSDAFFQGLVESSGAQILSTFATGEMKAYLLSESSLFVWPHKITMITCGQTGLVNAVKYLMKFYEKWDIEALFYERKNEYHPELQSTSVTQDMDALKLLIDGRVLRMGRQDDHHLYVFEHTKVQKPDPKDTTLQILMYDMDSSAVHALRQPDVKSKAHIEDIFKESFFDYQTDDYWFDPVGYSMNGVSGESYITVHATPEYPDSYISFEMSQVDQSEAESYIHKVLKHFEPGSFDVIYYDSAGQPLKDLDLNASIRQKVFCPMSSGHGLSFYQYSKSPNDFAEAHVF